MNTVYIHIDERLSAKQFRDIKKELLGVPHVCDVEYNTKLPHDLMVEFEADHNVPMAVLARLERRGLHPDIMSA